MNDTALLTKAQKAEWQSDGTKVRDWIEGQMSEKRPFLLAHHADGLIWGRYVKGNLQTAHDIDPQADFAPALESHLLQQAFIFGPESEIRLFQDAFGEWQAVHIIDPVKPEDIIEESQLLIGDYVVKQHDHFTHLQDRAQQGLDQIIPVAVSDSVADHLETYTPENPNPIRPRLMVHHHIAEDEKTGEAYIYRSRLVRVYLADNSGKEA